MIRMPTESVPVTRGFAHLGYPGGTTRVYTAGHSPIFHADLHCRELTDVAEVRLYPLAHIVTTDANPRTPCAHCTAVLPKTIAVAMECDGVDPADVVYAVDADADSLEDSDSPEESDATGDQP